jgi:putative redox protein
MFEVEVRNVAGEPAAIGNAGPYVYDLELSGEASPEALDALAAKVDEITEIPNSLRGGTPVTLGSVRAAGNR